MTPQGQRQNSDDRPVVVLIEDLAHRPYGHHPKTFAEVADGFVAAGCRVVVLISGSWALESTTPSFELYHYGPVASLAYRTSERFEAWTAALDGSGRWARTLGRLT